MTPKRIPTTDSISELAEFWETHDLTEFKDESEEVTESVFEADDTFTLQLQPDAAQAVRKIAESKGCPASKLIQLWVDEKIASSDANQLT